MNFKWSRRSLRVSVLTFSPRPSCHHITGCHWRVAVNVLRCYIRISAVQASKPVQCIRATGSGGACLSVCPAGEL
uniref:LARP5 protein n=1 Tax=Homo sapiens TaxID=9606 RepID=Q9BTS9_HUMAN|nr:LARP5 protein [Homo sapiens]